MFQQKKKYFYFYIS